MYIYITLGVEYQIVLRKLNQFIKKYYKNELIKGLIIAVSAVSLYYLLGVILEYYAHLGYYPRMIIFYSFIAFTIYTLWKYVFIPVFKLFNLGKTLSIEQAAKIIGKHFKQIDDRLVNVLQLTHIKSSSLELLNASIEQKSKEINPFNFSQAIDFKENRKFLKYFLPIVMVFVTIALGAPKIIKQGTERIVNYNRHFQVELPYQLVIENEKLEAVQNSNFVLNVTSEGEVVPDNIYIKYNGFSQKMKKESKSQFTHEFKSLQEDISFMFSDGENDFSPHTIKVLSKPLLLGFDLKLEYPKYLMMSDESMSNVGDIILPEGTKVNWYFNTQKTSDITIQFSDTTFSAEEERRDAFKVAKRIYAPQLYTLKLNNQEALTKDSITYSIQVIKDQYPLIQFNEYRDSTSLEYVYFSGKISDDYGFNRLIFTYNITTEKGEKSKVEQSSIPINTKLVKQGFNHVFKLSELALQSGDQLEYYFLVYDNDGVHGPKYTKSQVGFYKVPSKEELKQKKEENSENVKNTLKESISEAKQMQRDLKDLWKDLLEKKKPGWEEKNRLKDVFEKQQRLEEQLKRMQQENKKTLNEQKKFGEEDEKLLEKQQKIQELMENVLNDEMRQMMEEIQKMMEEMEKEVNDPKKMEDLTLNNEELEDNLDRTLELFKQLEFEQKLNENIDELKKLADEQKQLAEKTKKSDNASSEEMKEKQDELNKKTEELKKELEKMEELNNDLEFKNDLPEQTKEDMKDVQNEQKESMSNLDNKKQKKASENQENAGEKMEEMANKLESAQQQMEQEAQTENLEDMRQLLENLVELSFSQEDLMKEMQNTSVSDPKFRKLVQTQKKLKDDSEIIKDSLIALSKREEKIEPIISKELGELNKNMKEVMELLEGREVIKSSRKQQLIMTEVNNLALLFDEAIQQMQMQMQQQNQGNQSCNKPGSNGKPNVGSLKKMQQQLSKQLEQLKDELSKQENGQKSGGEKGNNPKMSQKLAKMAAEQEAIRRQLQKMSNELDEANGKKPGGNMKRIQDLMEENERDIVNKQITQETINRQNEILTRLLESEKAERERDLDDKRESNEANFAEERNPDDFFKYKDLKKAGEQEILRFPSPRLNSFYKNKVNRYLNNID